MSKKAKKIVGYCPDGSFGGQVFPFEDLFDEARNVKKEGLDGIDALILWGGADIHPSLYKQKTSFRTACSSKPSERDRFEWDCLLWCKMMDVPTIGICRGAQMQCAFAGGTLAQHVQGHNQGKHMVEDRSGQKYMVSSVHHQMMNPYTNRVPHELLAWAMPGVSEIYTGQDEKNIPEMEVGREPEIVWFPEIRGLAIQGHPEYSMHGTDHFVSECRRYVRELILEEKVTS